MGRQAGHREPIGRAHASRWGQLPAAQACARGADARHERAKIVPDLRFETAADLACEGGAPTAGRHRDLQIAAPQNRGQDEVTRRGAIDDVHERMRSTGR
jgi:hypothetical protein